MINESKQNRKNPLRYRGGCSDRGKHRFREFGGVFSEVNNDGLLRINSGGNYEFGGWYTTADYQDGTGPYYAGDPITVNGDMDLYAKWDKIAEPYTVKYAVCIWGIDQDKGKNGETLGLTFGPATGASYTKTFKRHSSGKDCLHNMTWTEIIEQSQKDPHYFDTCLENGCTHSVNINITGALKGTDCSGQMDAGDGTGILYNSIASDYRMWNSERSDTGGWPASRMRATFNGSDSRTNTSVAGTDCLTASTCLLAMFPKELRDGIVAKAVKSDTVYNDVSDNNTTTYDKLWLFSGKEVYGSGSKDNVIRPNEGELYQRSKNLGITTTMRSALVNYTESDSAYYWWLRSADRVYSAYVCLVYNYGDWDYSRANTTGSGIAPGFCLK